MDTSIHFNNQSFFGTVKIRNEKIQVIPSAVVNDGMLPKKFIPLNLTIADSFPKNLFRTGLILSKHSGKYFNF